MLAFLKKLFYAIALGAFVLFAVQNLDALSTKVMFQVDLFKDGWLFETPQLPVALLLIAFFVLGLLAAGTHSMVDRVSYKAELRSRNKKIKELEAELARYRTEEARLAPPEPVKTIAPKPTEEEPEARETSEPEKRPVPYEEEPTL